jgi:hypothetical protein
MEQKERTNEIYGPDVYKHKLGCQTRANPGFSPDGTQLGIVLLSF